MLIFSQGFLVLANLFYLNNLPVAPKIRRLTGLAYLLFGVMFILSGIWHVLFIGAFAAMILLLVAERKIIIRRRSIGR